MNNIKICIKCNKELPLDSFRFHAETADRVHPECNACHKAYNATWYQRNRERCRLLQKEYRIKNHAKLREIERRSYQKNKEKTQAQAKNYISRLKDKVYALYGNKCACCGDTHREFFALDHLDGGGTQERKKLGTRGLFIRAARPEFQKDKYQLLCHNCNMSLGFFGYCPHRPHIKRQVLSRLRLSKPSES